MSKEINMDPLTELADKYGTDKGHSHWCHMFTPFYHSKFEPVRFTAKKILEIGVYEFKSHRMWKDYFTNAQIYGMEFGAVRSNFGIEVFNGDQANRTHLAEMMKKFGGDFDIIIDDGGHFMNQQQISLGFLFKFLKSGGMYSIEDLHTSDWGVTFGARADKSNSTLKFLTGIRDTHEIVSEYLKPEETAYLKQHIESVEIFARDVNRVTSLIRKIR